MFPIFLPCSSLFPSLPVGTLDNVLLYDPDFVSHIDSTSILLRSHKYTIRIYPIRDIW